MPRLHSSAHPIDRLTPRGQLAFQRKPTGLWWAQDLAWRSLVAARPQGQGLDARTLGGFNYEVELDPAFNLLRLETWDEIRDFSVEFGQPMPHATRGFWWQHRDPWRYDPAQDPEMPGRMRVFLIDWPEVAQRWDGIEIVGLQENRAGRPQVEWLDIDWAVSSGCAWSGMDGVRLRLMEADAALEAGDPGQPCC